MELTKEDIKWLINVASNTISKPPKGLCDTFYKTCTYEGDLKLYNRLLDIKKKVGSDD